MKLDVDEDGSGLRCSDCGKESSVDHALMLLDAKHDGTRLRLCVECFALLHMAIASLCRHGAVLVMGENKGEVH